MDNFEGPDSGLGPVHDEMLRVIKDIKILMLQQSQEIQDLKDACQRALDKLNFLINNPS